MKTINFLLIIIPVLAGLFPVDAQDSIKVVIISDKVGPFIELKEQYNYKLFPDVNNFVLAYTTKTKDDIYTAKVYYIADRILQEKSVNIKEKIFLAEAERICNYNKIKFNSYKKGSNPAQLEYIWLSKVDIDRKLDGELKSIYNYILPYEKNYEYSCPIKSYPWLWLSIGVSYTNFSFADLSSLTDAVYLYFRQTNTAFPEVNPNFDLFGIVRTKATLDITSYLSAVNNDRL